MRPDSFAHLFEAAIDFMHSRGWRELTAKSREFEQSLFDHTLVEIDVLLQLAPIFARANHFALTAREIEVLVAALMAHDVGKELEEWQSYILGRGASLSDVNRALTAEVVPTLYPALGLGDAAPEINQIVENCINLHMSHERRPANLMSAILNAPKTGGNRWFALAELVYHLDNLCSIGNCLGALDYLRDPRRPFARHLHAQYHQVALRGVSSVMLHKAAQTAFEERGWRPLLYFRDATIYVRSATEPQELATPEEIHEQLVGVLQMALGQDVARLVVGSPTASMLPKPDLFDAAEVREYLTIATQRISRSSFRKKPVESRGATKGQRQVVAEYRGVKPPEVDEAILWRERDRIADAQPEMVAFKFFKAMMSSELIGDDGSATAARLYDEWLGSGAWNQLQSMSTLMPARDMPHVDRFWRVPGRRFGLPVETVEELAAESGTELLVEQLTQIARQVYATLDAPPSRKALATDMASAFVKDLLTPAPQTSLSALAKAQQDAYASSKPFAGRMVRRAQYFCSICNTPFSHGTEARADFLDNPASHTNRAVSHGNFDKLVICNTCKYERLLRQLLLNARAQNVLILFPRLSIGPAAGAFLMQKARGLCDRLQNLMVGAGDDPDTRVSLALTNLIAQKGIAQSLYGLTPQEIGDLFSYRASKENQRKHRRELEKALKEACGENVSDANAEWGTDYPDWEAALDAVVANKVEDAREIRRTVYNLTLRLALVCQTPNLLLIPIADPLAMRGESDTNATLRKVFVELVLALALDCAVAIVGDNEPFAVPEPNGIAWVPPVGPARRLLGDMLERLERRRPAEQRGKQQAQRARLAATDWIPLDHGQSIFRAIGAASLVANDTNYSDRSHLYQVLSAPTVGHVLRRIEQNSTTGQAAPYHLPALVRLEEVLP